jgi:hypothetical protein
MDVSLVSASGFSLMPFIGSAFVGIVIIAVWVLLASSRFVQGGVVERPERVPQLYGYTVCLVMLIWAVASTISLVGASLTLNDPLYRGDREFGPFEPSVSSYEAYRSTLESSRRFSSPETRGTPVDSIPEPVLRRRYEALRADRIARNTVEARRSLVTDSLSLVIAALLFFLHWRWLRRTVGPAAPATTTRIDI